MPCARGCARRATRLWVPGCHYNPEQASSTGRQQRCRAVFHLRLRVSNPTLATTPNSGELGSGTTLATRNPMSVFSDVGWIKSRRDDDSGGGDIRSSGERRLALIWSVVVSMPQVSRISEVGSSNASRAPNVGVQSVTTLHLTAWQTTKRGFRESSR